MTKLAVVALAFAFPALALAQSEGDYASLKLGAVVPQHRDLKGFGTGLDVDAALGYRIAPNLALEAGAAGAAAAKVKRMDYFVPALGKGAEMLQGSREEIIDKVIELVAAKGGLR